MSEYTFKPGKEFEGAFVLKLNDDKTYEWVPYFEGAHFEGYSLLVMPVWAPLLKITPDGCINYNQEDDDESTVSRQGETSEQAL